MSWNASHCESVAPVDSSLLFLSLTSSWGMTSSAYRQYYRFWKAQECWTPSCRSPDSPHLFKKNYSRIRCSTRQGSACSIIQRAATSCECFQKLGLPPGGHPRKRGRFILLKEKTWHDIHWEPPIGTALVHGSSWKDRPLRQVLPKASVRFPMRATIELVSITIAPSSKLEQRL